jgi:predicted tellurium resistance membrane protein TerC
MEWITDSQIWLSLITLTALEIILGIDNIVVISLLTNKLPHEQQPKARKIGIGLALITRILFLLSIAWLASLTIPLFSLFNINFSVRDLILIAGGLFLLYKGTHEIHGMFEKEDTSINAKVKATFTAVVTQIILFDIVFSIDSVITAIGMAQQLGVMIAAIVIAMILMLVASTAISNFSPSSVTENACIEFSAHDRGYFDGRRDGIPYTKGLYLFCNGVFRIC